MGVELHCLSKGAMAVFNLKLVSGTAMLIFFFIICISFYCVPQVLNFGFFFVFIDVYVTNKLFFYSMGECVACHQVHDLYAPSRTKYTTNCRRL